MLRFPSRQCCWYITPAAPTQIRGSALLLNKSTAAIGLRLYSDNNKPIPTTELSSAMEGQGATTTVHTSPPPLSPLLFTTSAPEKDLTKMIQRVEARAAHAYRETLEPLDSNQYFVSKETHTRTPMVMLLGNHSSGKSTLINSLLGGRKIQATGVAPTDDGFTVIMRGHHDVDEDGPTAVSNPSYGFEGLRDFGHGMFAHFKVKTRVLQDPLDSITSSNNNNNNASPNTIPSPPVLPHNLMLIDTPGMIDTPEADRKGSFNTTQKHSLSGGNTLQSSSSSRKGRQEHDRGYDFLGVVRWFALRCDVVLLMFDPSNPGTTGETLEILRHSLRGLDHKFIIVFNKVDVFEKAPDFARCYGALCWNLSKVIDRKDLPRIYTMFTDRNSRNAGGGGALAANNNNNKLVGAAAEYDASAPEYVSLMCLDFKDTREEVLRDVLSAPVRRLDNLITELDHDARHLHMCLTILSELKVQYRRSLWRTYLTIGCTATIVPACIVGAQAVFGVGAYFIASSSIIVGVGATIISIAWLRMHSKADSLIQNLDAIFEEKYYTQLQGSGMADLRDIWTTVRSKLKHSFQTRIHSVNDIRITSRHRLNTLQEIYLTEIPELRKIAHEIKRTKGVTAATTKPHSIN